MTPTLIVLLALLGHWGEVGHRLIGAAAAAALPADMPTFAPDHYIDLERVPAGALYARDRFGYGSNPHHTTIHFDGWVGDNPHGYTLARGFHESIFVHTHFTGGDRRVDESPRVFPSLREAILAYLHESNTLVPRLYDLDKRWTAWITSGQPVETVESVIQDRKSV